MKKVFKFFLSIFVSFFFVLNLSCISLYSSDNIDLVKLKKKEEERRKKLKKTKFTVNNHNLNKIKVYNKSYSFVQMQPVEGYEQDKDKLKTKEKKKKPIDPKKTRKYWQDLKNKLEHDLNELKKKTQEGQLKLNKMYTDYYSMDLPSRRDLKDRIDIFSDSLENDKLKLENLKKDMDSLADKARKAGVPPGWIR